MPTDLCPYRPGVRASWGNVGLLMPPDAVGVPPWPDPFPVLEAPPCGCAEVRVVSFSEYERHLLGVIARRRRLEVSQRTLANPGGRSETARAWTELVGVTGEGAVGKFTGTWWLGSARGERDVGTILEVRAAERHTHRLLVYEADPAEAWVVFATVERADQAWLHGTMQMGDAKRRGWWNPYLERPAYCVPHAALGPLPQRFCVAYGLPERRTWNGPVA